MHESKCETDGAGDGHPMPSERKKGREEMSEEKIIRNKILI
jgi:hypothetical protein